MAGDINFKWPLKANSRGFPNSHRSFQGAIKEDLKILVLTKRGERLMHPDMGTKIAAHGSVMFENVDTKEIRELLLEDIKETVTKYLPAVEIVNLVVQDSNTSARLGNNELLINIIYAVRGTNGFSDQISIRVSE